MYIKAYLESSRISILSLRKSQKIFIVGVRLGSKYASGIGFTVEKVYVMQHLSDIVQVDFKNLLLPSCFSN